MFILCILHFLFNYEIIFWGKTISIYKIFLTQKIYCKIGRELIQVPVDTSLRNSRSLHWHGCSIGLGISLCSVFIRWYIHSIKYFPLGHWKIFLSVSILCTEQSPSRFWLHKLNSICDMDTHICQVSTQHSQ